MGKYNKKRERTGSKQFTTAEKMKDNFFANSERRKKGYTDEENRQYKKYCKITYLLMTALFEMVISADFQMVCYS